MSQFAGTVCVQAKDLKECLRILPKELSIEIFSYLNMGIILTLYDQFKPIILDCLKKERAQQKKPFSSFFYDLSKKELINMILETESINKKMIMKAYFQHRQKLIETQQLKKIEAEMQRVLFETLQVENVLQTTDKCTYLNTNTYLIIKRCKKSFRAINVSIRSPADESDLYTLIIPPRKRIHTIPITRLYIHDNVVNPQSYHWNNIKHCKAVNKTAFVRIVNMYGGNVHVGTFPRADAVGEIEKYYNTLV
jgi:hypothetical protein